MEFLAHQGSITEVSTPLLAVNLFQGEQTPGGATAAVDRALDGLITGLISEGEIKGKLGEITIIHTQGKIPAQRVAVVGMGPREKLELDVVRRASGSLRKRAGELGAVEYHTILFGTGAGGLGVADSAQAMVEGAVLAGYGYREFKGSDPDPVERMTLVEFAHERIMAVPAGIERGRIMAEAACTARDLAAAPPNLATPEFLAERAQIIAGQSGLECQVIEPEEMERLGMGALLAVGAGSVHPPRMIVMRYQGDPASKELLALVGKGITFDSGGISIKPAENMDRMKYDKSGAAAVIGAMQGIAALKPKVNILGIAVSAENLPGATAYRPGDIVRAMNGKTIEVISTDAEGRLVLADALSYAVVQGATAIVDLATLTGGVAVALGTGGAGIMGNDDGLIAALREAGDRAGERLWQLPIWDDYLWEQVRSEFADIKNSGGRFGSSPVGGLFLSLFVGEVPWAHLDIAGVAWVDKDKPSLPKSYIPRGPTAFGTRLLLEFILNRSES